MALRLLASSDFTFVFQMPLRISTSYITILSRLNKLEHPRIGLAIAKKYVKRAYMRNQIKRIARESFRQRQHELLAMDFIVIARQGITNLDKCALIQALEKLWRHHYR